MCYFITIAVPANRSETVEKSVPRGLHIGATANPTLKRHMPDNTSLYLVMSGGCACDLFFESGKDTGNRDPEEHDAKLRLKYQKKGWSKSKIERAVSQAMKDAGSHPAPAEAGLRSDVREYFSGLLKDIKELKIYIQWYAANVETEKVSVKQGPRLSEQLLRVDNAVKDTETIYTVIA